MTDTDVRKLVFAKEYDAQVAIYGKAGITKERYIQSRMRDEGLVDLELLTGSDLDTLRFEGEYFQHAEIFAQQGITMEQYVRSRRIDEGIDTLQPGCAS